MFVCTRGQAAPAKYLYFVRAMDFFDAACLLL
jgi:hypothetical protein